MALKAAARISDKDKLVQAVDIQGQGLEKDNLFNLVLGVVLPHIVYQIDVLDINLQLNGVP